MSEARVKVALRDGSTIEIEGTESFVSAQLEKFGQPIRAGLAGGREEPPAAAADDPAGAGALDDIFAATDTGVRIVTDIPGDSVHEKMANAGKLLAYGIARLRNRTVVRFDEVTAACKTHRCYDGMHLASSLKTQKSKFVFAGRAKRQTLALTASGTSDAEKLIEKIRAAGHPTPVRK